MVRCHRAAAPRRFECRAAGFGEVISAFGGTARLGRFHILTTDQGHTMPMPGCCLREALTSPAA